MTEHFLSRARGTLHLGARAVLAAVALSLLSGVTAAQESAPKATQSNWQAIAKQSIVFRGLIRRINLATKTDPVLGLKIRTRGRRMTFSSIEVRYRDGKIQRVRRRIRLDSGEFSAVFAESSEGRFIDEVVLIPDVSAPRRRAINVEIHALIAIEKPAKTNALASQSTTQSPRESTKELSVTSRTTNDPASQKTPAGTTQQKSVEPALPQQGRMRRSENGVAAASAPSSAAKPRDSDPTTTTAARNTLASTTNTIDLPSPRPKSEPSPQPVDPPTVRLGQPTTGGNVLIGLGALSPSDSPMRFEIKAEPRRFRRLHLHISARDVRIDHLVLQYTDGSLRKEPFDVVLLRNTRSRWISADATKLLKEVIIHSVASDTSKGAARVELLAKPAAEALLPDAVQSTNSDGWVLIAAQSGRVLRNSEGRMPVAANRGGFRQLRLKRLGRLPRPSALILRPNSEGGETVSLQTGRTDKDLDLPTSQRLPIADVSLRLSARAIQQLPASGIYQIWAKY